MSLTVLFDVDELYCVLLRFVSSSIFNESIRYFMVWSCLWPCCSMSTSCIVFCCDSFLLLFLMKVFIILWYGHVFVRAVRCRRVVLCFVALPERGWRWHDDEPVANDDDRFRPPSNLTNAEGAQSSERGRQFMPPGHGGWGGYRPPGCSLLFPTSLPSITDSINKTNP